MQFFQWHLKAKAKWREGLVARVLHRTCDMAMETKNGMFHSETCLRGEQMSELGRAKRLAEEHEATATTEASRSAAALQKGKRQRTLDERRALIRQKQQARDFLNGVDKQQPPPSGDDDTTAAAAASEASSSSASVLVMAAVVTAVRLRSR